MVNLFKKWKRYAEISEVAPIARRFFVMNAFDGSLTTLGIIMGAWISNGGLIRFFSSFIFSPDLISFVVLTGFATSVAMGVSGLWGSYLTEAAERTKEIKDLESSMACNEGELKHSVFGKAQRFASIVAALVDGLSPAGAALLCLIPFFIGLPFNMPNPVVFPASLVMTFIVLFVLGMYLGRLSKTRLIISGVKMMIAGFMVIGLTLLLPQI
jgi:predicted membrane protein (TIGR00267 family)